MTEFFVWDKDVQEAVRRVREHAEKPANWYRVGAMTGLPGEDPRFVVRSGTTKAVFTWTVTGRSWNPRHPPAGSVLRHLTVSVQGDGRYPRTEVCWTLAHHLGFTGASPDDQGLCHKPAPLWALGKDDDDQCIIVQQLVEGVTGAPPPSVVS